MTTQWQFDPKNVDPFSEKFKFFKSISDEDLSLLSENGSITEADARELFDKFDVFINESKIIISDIVKQKNEAAFFGKIGEILTFFNYAATVFKPLAKRIGTLVTFLKSFLDGGGPPGTPFSYVSYSIQFGFPSLVSISFNFNN